jgi:hypothetical protein
LLVLVFLAGLLVQSSLALPRANAGNIQPDEEWGEAVYIPIAASIQISSGSTPATATPTASRTPTDPGIGTPTPSPTAT